MNVADKLSEIPLFAGLLPEQYALLAERFRCVTLQPGEDIVRQGDLSTRLYLIAQGVVTFHTANADGVERVVGSASTGQWFGEEALVTQEMAKYSANLANPAEFCILERQDFDALVQEHPEIWTALVKLRNERFKVTQGLSWLAEGEIVVLIIRKHWFRLVQGIVVPFAVALLFLGLIAAAPAFIQLPGNIWTGASVIVAIVALIVLVYGSLNYYNDEYVVTNKRVAHVERQLLVNEVREEIPIEKIQQVTLKKENLLHAALGVTDLYIESAALKTKHLFDSDLLGELHFTDIADGERVRRAIDDQRRFVRERLGAETRQRNRGRLQQDLRAYILAEAPPVTPPNPAPANAPKRKNIRTRLRQTIAPKLEEGGAVIYRKHWAELVKQTWKWVGLLILVTGFSALEAYTLHLDLPWPVLATVAAFWLGLFGKFMWEWEDWKNDLYKITESQVIDIERKPFGLDEKSTTAFLENVQDVRYEQPNLLHSVLNYGNVQISTAGAKEPLIFYHVPNPKSIAQDVFTRSEAWKRKKADNEEIGRNKQVLDAIISYHRLVGGPAQLLLSAPAPEPEPIPLPEPEVLLPPQDNLPDLEPDEAFKQAPAAPLSSAGLQERPSSANIQAPSTGRAERPRLLSRPAPRTRIRVIVPDK